MYNTVAAILNCKQSTIHNEYNMYKTVAAVKKTVTASISKKDKSTKSVSHQTFSSFLMFRSDFLLLVSLNIPFHASTTTS